MENLVKRLRKLRNPDSLDAADVIEQLMKDLDRSMAQTDEATKLARRALKQ